MSKRKRSNLTEEPHDGAGIPITFGQLAPLFHLPLREAATQLLVCTTVLKKRCRNLGIHRWPYRKMRSLERQIEQIADGSSEEAFQLQAQIEALRQNPLGDDSSTYSEAQDLEPEYYSAAEVRKAEGVGKEGEEAVAPSLARPSLAFISVAAPITATSIVSPHGRARTVAHAPPSQKEIFPRKDPLYFFSAENDFNPFQGEDLLLKHLQRFHRQQPKVRDHVHQYNTAPSMSFDFSSFPLEDTGMSSSEDEVDSEGGTTLSGVFDEDL